MIQKFAAVVFGLLLSTSLMVSAKLLSLEEKKSDFQQLNLLIDSSYAPKIYKSETQKISLPDLRNQYFEKIERTATNLEFYQVMIQYVAEFKDGHFGLSIPTTYLSEIPLNTDLVDGHVLIGEIDRTKLSEKDFPFEKGDEVISIDGKPVMDIVQELSRNISSGYSETVKRNAAQLLFIRSARRFIVPTGESTLMIRRGTSSIIEPVKLNWIEKGVPFDEKGFFNLLQFPQFAKAPMNYDLLSIKNDVVELLGSERAERSYRCSGETRIAMPADATQIMKKPFVAYYHPTERGNIGYLRIPHYSWNNVVIDGVTYTSETVFLNYQYAIQQLEKNTVGLVIDQDHNCGGSVAFLHSLLGLFISTPVQPMQFELLATKKEYLSFETWLKEVPAGTIQHEELKGVLGLVKTTWEKGDFLTQKTSLFGNQYLIPDPVTYTKPIVMLIDELSGSGGDAFPAQMGGYGRATLLGTRTAGLGGHVEEPEPLHYSGLNIRITKSLFYRPDGVPVENNGAVPHVNYTITRDDYVYKYKDYQKFYLKTLFELIP